MNDNCYVACSPCDNCSVLDCSDCHCFYKVDNFCV